MLPTNDRYPGRESATWVGVSLGRVWGRAMVFLNPSEAETFQQFLNGERLWSWPNGRVQLGQSFPDLGIVNHLVGQGFLNRDYEPTEGGRAALQSWLNSKDLPATTVLRTPDASLRPRLS